jgi:hypothetical protein
MSLVQAPVIFATERTAKERLCIPREKLHHIAKLTHGSRRAFTANITRHTAFTRLPLWYILGIILLHFAWEGSTTTKPFSGIVQITLGPSTRH